MILGQTTSIEIIEFSMDEATRHLDVIQPFLF